MKKQLEIEEKGLKEARGWWLVGVKLAIGMVGDGIRLSLFQGGGEKEIAKKQKVRAQAKKKLIEAQQKKLKKERREEVLKLNEARVKREFKIGQEEAEREEEEVLKGEKIEKKKEAPRKTETAKENEAGKKKTEKLEQDKLNFSKKQVIRKERPREIIWETEEKKLGLGLAYFWASAALIIGTCFMFWEWQNYERARALPQEPRVEKVAVREIKTGGGMAERRFLDTQKVQFVDYEEATEVLLPQFKKLQKWQMNDPQLNYNIRMIEANL